jgi:hypothetical protein
MSYLNGALEANKFTTTASCVYLDTLCQIGSIHHEDYDDSPFLSTIDFRVLEHGFGSFGWEGLIRIWRKASVVVWRTCTLFYCILRRLSTYRDCEITTKIILEPFFNSFVNFGILLSRIGARKRGSASQSPC